MNFTNDNKKYKEALLKWSGDSMVVEQFREMLSEQRKEYFKSEENRNLLGKGEK